MENEQCSKQCEDDDIMKEQEEKRIAALALFNTCSDQWSSIRKAALEDLDFYSGKQWEDSVASSNRTKGEPTLAVNRLPQFVKQIENELRQREINIAVAPNDVEGSTECADIYNGLIRSIQEDSKATQHYIHAAGENGALVPGFGFLKVEIEPVSKKNWSDDKKLIINSVFDPFSVLPDYSTQTNDFSDAEYWFEIVDYTEDSYRSEFPHSHLASLDVDTVGKTQWNAGISSNSDSVRVVRYWHKETISYVQYLLEDGSEIDSIKYEKPHDVDATNEDMNGKLPFPTNAGGDKRIVSRSRQAIKTTIKWFDFNAVEILREGTWPGENYPFVAVIGPQTVVNGNKDIRGVIRYSKDSQRMLNYMASSIARRIGSANKSPWIADKRSLGSNIKQWQTANTENWSVLLYDAFRENPAVPGSLIPNPPPVRADQTSQINDLLAASAHWTNELKATIGIYDAGLGATPNEQSGVAINTLAQQGANANYHFSENLVCSIKHLGNILIGLIPLVYNTERVIRIVNTDSSIETVKINQLFDQNGKQLQYDLTGGEYSVTVNAGPAYATRKQAALEQLLSVTRVDPTLTPVLQDLMVGAMDFEGAEIAKKRLLKLFAVNFPNLQNEDDDFSPQAQAVIAKQEAMLKQFGEEYQKLQAAFAKEENINKTDAIKIQGQIEVANNSFQHEVELERLRTEGEMRLAALKAEAAEIESRLKHNVEMHKTLLPHCDKTPPTADLGEVTPF